MAKKPTAKKSRTRKTTPKKPTAKKTAARKPAASKKSSKKTVSQKTTAPARKSTKKQKPKVTRKPRQPKPKKLQIPVVISNTPNQDVHVKLRHDSNDAPIASTAQKSERYKVPKPSRISRYIEYGLLLVLFAIALSFAFTEYVVSPRVIDDGRQPIADNQQPVITGIDGRYLFSGTIVWDRNVEEWSKNENGVIRPEHPFGNLDSYQPERYDAWVADLECPTSSVDIPFDVGMRTLEFNCRQEYLPYAAQYFDFFNLSNNHSDNSGRDKLEETRTVLEEFGFQYFGDPDPDRSDLTCEIVGLPVKVSKSTGASLTQSQAMLPVVFCAWHYFLRLPRQGEIDVLRRYAEHMPVFAFVHMGTEYQPQANQYQQAVAHAVIDAGADFVIANNPHWVQNAEAYNGRLIVYSTGNFIFDQTSNQELRSSVSIDTKVNFKLNDDIDRWLALGPRCAEYRDTCLGIITSENLQKLEAGYEFEPIAGMIDKDMPQIRATPDIQAFIENRLGWSTVQALLLDD